MREWGERSAPVAADAEPKKNSNAIKHIQSTTASGASPPPPEEHWPAPLAETAYHGLAGEVVRTIAPHSEADPAALLIQFLVAVGSCIGRGPHYAVEGDQHHANLYAALVGASGKARKGTSWGRIRQVFRLVEDVWASQCINTGISSGEGLIWAVRDETDQDPGTPDKRLLVQESEFAGVLRVMAREGNIVSIVLRNAWDGDRLNNLTKKCDTQATGAHISIVGHITADELTRYLDRTEAGNGFANRFLFMLVRRARYLPHGGNLDERALHPLARRLAETIEQARDLERITMGTAGERLWEQVYPRLSDGQPGLYGAITGRAEAQVIRLALIYALLDASSSIGPPHLLAALAIWRYASDSVRHIFGDAIGDPIADRILEALRAAPAGLSQTELSTALGRNASAERLLQALSILRRAGRIRGEEVYTGRRPRTIWSLVTHSNQ